ncbi:hypothetical protein, partial [Bradyrhizobium sp. SZCCHNPS1003]|uniref:hypothetical protein n=1 Tax=Bradyrhizobium sp. SZCCHNPS1003 TaxID=3057330 RepID=UPI0028ECEB50
MKIGYVKRPGHRDFLGEKDHEVDALSSRGELTSAGCLTSEDEERETWTAESLRVSGLRASAFGSGIGREDFGGQCFKGNTMVFA